MILPVYVAPKSVLRAQAAKITEVTPELRQLVVDMIDTMHNAKGIGLAAPQIGKSIALCVIDLALITDDQTQEPLALINPRITWKSTKRCVYAEGCLSLPGIEADIQRPESVRVKAEDLGGNELTIEADGLLARVLQHEIDHLNGKLFTDYVTRKRDLFERETPDYPRI